MTGILNLDKPAGWTSHDAVAKLRRILGERRIGHGGTLDPMATGVLPVFVGRATRAVEFLEAADKEYEAGLRLGIITDTQDTTGQILEERPVSISEEELRSAILGLRGEREQLPPMYSAVKVGGKALYAYARAGKDVERKPRHITIYSSEPLGWVGEEYRFRANYADGSYWKEQDTALTEEEWNRLVKFLLKGKLRRNYVEDPEMEILDGSGEDFFADCIQGLDPGDQGLNARAFSRKEEKRDPGKCAKKSPA